MARRTMTSRSGLAILTTTLTLGVAACASTSMAEDTSGARATEPSKPQLTPVRIERATPISVQPVPGFFARNGHLAVTWSRGPACSGAGASSGTFDHMDVVETKTTVKITVWLRNARVNPSLSDDAPRCTVVVPAIAQLLSLKTPIGRRAVLDGSCTDRCRVPMMDVDAKKKLIGAIR